LSSVNDLSEDIIQIIKNNESDEYFPMIQEKVKVKIKKKLLGYQ